MKQKLLVPLYLMLKIYFLGQLLEQCLSSKYNKLILVREFN